MLKKVKKMFQSKFVKLWVILLLLVVGILIAQQSRHTPTLEEVLTLNQVKPAGNLSMFIGSLLAFSLVALSVAKGYEVFRRSRPIDEAVRAELAMDTVDLAEHDELKQRAAELNEHNMQLRATIDKLSPEFNKLKAAEQMLRKNNISLSKEFEKLKFESEALILKIDAAKVKPKAKKLKIKARRRVSKAKPRARKKRK
ncbi:hypothetical protein ACFL5U_03770 [Candidatus Margulisiibacteriota bacterium]